MRILQVIPFFTPEMGGSAHVAFQIASKLAERNHDIEVVTSDFAVDRSRFEARSFRVTYLHSALSKWGFFVTPELMTWAREHLTSFDVIHMHTVRTFQNAIIRRYAIRYGKPYVMSAHGTLPIIVQRQTPKRVYDLLVGNRLIADAAQFIAVSPFEADQYVAAGIRRDRVRVVLNGIDLREFETLPTRGQLRNRFAVPDGVSIILYLGRLHQRKGIGTLIEAFARIREERPDTLLMITGPDDGELATLKSLVNALGLNDHVCFTGPLYDRDRLSALVDADLLVSPAIHEIFGLVPFEALMCGTPVVVADDSGSGQLIDEAKAGYLVHYGDVGALTDVIQYALTHQSETMAMVQAGQAFVRSRLQWPGIVQELEEVYAGQLAAARGSCARKEDKG